MLDFFSMLTGGAPRYPWEMDPTAGGIPYMNAYDAGGGGDDAPGQPPVLAGGGSGPGGMLTADEYRQRRGQLPDQLAVPRSLSPELYRPLNLTSTLADQGPPPGSSLPIRHVPGEPPPQPPNMPPAGPPAAPGTYGQPPAGGPRPATPAVPGVLQPKPASPLGGLFGGMLGGGGMTGPDGKELTTEQMMDKVLRMQLQRAMMPDWGAMAAAFAEAGKPSLLPTGGMGAALGKAAAAMGGGGGKDALHMMEIMQKVQDAKEKSASRKELGVTLKAIDEELARRKSGVRINTKTGAIIPPSPPGAPAAGSSGGGIPNMTAADAGGGGDDGGEPSGGGDGWHPVDIIPKYESGNRNIMQGVVPAGGGYNPSVGRVTGPSTAQGYWQITNSTWRGAAPRAGVDLAEYPNAMSAPREVQREVAKQLYAERGFADWAPYNKNLRAALARGEGGSGGGGGRTQVASAGGGIPYMTAADAGGGGDDGGGAGYDDALALLLAQLGAQSQLAGFGDIAKPYETYLYNTPGYIREKQRAQTGGEWDVREPIETRAREHQSGLDRAKEAARLKIELENKKAEQENAARYDTLPQPVWVDGPNGPELRPMTRYEFMQRQLYPGAAGPGAGPAAGPGGPAPATPPMAAPGPLPGAPNMRAGGALPLAAPAPQGAPGGAPAEPGPAAPPPAPPQGRGGILPQPQGELAKDHKWTMTPQGWKQEVIVGSPTYKAQVESEASELKVANRGIQSIDRALSLSNNWSTGFWGARLAGIEGGPSYNLAAEVTQLRAITSFAELQKMRAASPTGGALGAVSDTEGKKLESTITQLDQFQDKKLFDASLGRLKEEYLDTVYGSKEKIDRAVKEGKLPQRVADQVEALKAQALGRGPGGSGAPAGAAPAQPGGSPARPVIKGPNGPMTLSPDGKSWVPL